LMVPELPTVTQLQLDKHAMRTAVFVALAGREPVERRAQHVIVRQPERPFGFFLHQAHRLGFALFGRQSHQVGNWQFPSPGRNNALHWIAVDGV
jgi:hypothetical protein